MPVTNAKIAASGQHHKFHSLPKLYKQHKNYGGKSCDKTHSSSISDLILASRKPYESLIKIGEQMSTNSMSSKPRDQRFKSHKFGKTSWTNRKVDDYLIARKADFDEDLGVSLAGLSNSHLKLLPYAEYNPKSIIHTAEPELIVFDSLNSADNKWPTLGALERNFDLEKLVERAERKWEINMAEKIVEGEYEVLDTEGENVSLARSRKKGSKGKADKQLSKQPCTLVDEEDGFELI